MVVGATFVYPQEEMTANKELKDDSNITTPSDGHGVYAFLEAKQLGTLSGGRFWREVLTRGSFMVYHLMRYHSVAMNTSSSCYQLKWEIAVMICVDQFCRCNINCSYVVKSPRERRSEIFINLVEQVAEEVVGNMNLEDNLEDPWPIYRDNRPLIHHIISVFPPQESIFEDIPFAEAHLSDMIRKYFTVLSE